MCLHFLGFVSLCCIPLRLGKNTAVFWSCDFLLDWATVKPLKMLFLPNLGEATAQHMYRCIIFYEAN